MRFIKDLIAWKQQSAAAEEAEYEEEDEAEEDIWGDEDDWEDDEDYDDEDALWEEEETPAAAMMPPSAAAMPPAAVPSARPAAPISAAPAAERNDTYDLLSRVAKSSVPEERPARPAAPRVNEPAPTRPMTRAAAPVPPRPARYETIPIHLDPPEAAETVPTAPQPPTPQPAAPVPEPVAARPAKIWDIAPDEPPARRTEPEAPPAPAEPPRMADPVPPQPAAPAPTSEAPRASTGRAKTRLLGFHMDEIDSTDPFDAPRAAVQSESVTFPTGWLVIIEGPGVGACFTLRDGVSQIGRGEDQTVRLDFGDTSISRNNHAAVAYDPETGKFYLGHGGKSNLVRLNGRPVLSTEELFTLDRIRIGETVLRFVGFCDEDFTWSEDAGRDADAKAG